MAMVMFSMARARYLWIFCQVAGYPGDSEGWDGMAGHCCRSFSVVGSFYYLRVVKLMYLMIKPSHQMPLDFRLALSPMAC
jgi:hypothetical protein